MPQLCHARIFGIAGLAKEMQTAGPRGERLELSDEELAFYDALGTIDSAVQVLGDATLTAIAREIATTHWSTCESRRTDLRRLVRRTLRKWGYPPDKMPEAVQTVVRQAELTAGVLAAKGIARLWPIHA